MGEAGGQYITRVDTTLMPVSLGAPCLMCAIMGPGHGNGSGGLEYLV